MRMRMFPAFLASVCVFGSGIMGGAAERTTTTKLQQGRGSVIDTAAKPTQEIVSKEPTATKPYLISTLEQPWLTADDGNADDNIVVEQVEEEAVEAVLLPLHYFDPDDNDNSIINSTILAYLSMLVYSSHANLIDFDSEMEDALLPLGAIDVEAFIDPYGTEGVIVKLQGATIIAFRGTSSDGTNIPLADYLADINDDPYLVDVDGDEMYVHEGFWHNADTALPYVAQAAADGFAAGDSIWLTGHSLGGALATLTALRLHYVEAISIQGLHTFGSPRAGDLAMFTKFFTPNIHDDCLWDATQRWVVDGDTVTTYFYGDYVGVPYLSTYVKYEHVGTTNTIYPLGGGAFEIKYNTGEDKEMETSADGVAADGSGEHLWYHHALTDELFFVLDQQGETELAFELYNAFKL